MTTSVASDLFSEIRGLDEQICQKIYSIENKTFEEITIVVCKISVNSYFGRFLRHEYGLYILAHGENGQMKMHAMRLGREHHNVNMALAAIKLTLLASSMEEPGIQEFDFFTNDGAPY